MFRGLRRQDRQIEKNQTIDILEKANYGVLSTVDDNGQPYGVPLNYVYEKGALYFHCAIEGYKLDNIKNNSKVSFCVVGHENVLPDKFSTDYESVIIFGRAEEVFDDEKNRALLGLIDKYSPDYMEKGKEYIIKLECRTKVIKVNIEHISGKARK